MIKEYLRSIRKLYKEIEVKRRQRERLYHTVTSSGIKLKDIDVQTSIPGDVLGDTIAEVADLDRGIREDIANLCAMQEQASKMLSTLSKPEYRAVMIDYYLNTCTWDQVAEHNGYSIQHTYRIHGEALQELEKMRVNESI